MGILLRGDYRGWKVYDGGQDHGCYCCRSVMACSSGMIVVGLGWSYFIARVPWVRGCHLVSCLVSIRRSVLLTRN